MLVGATKKMYLCRRCMHKVAGRRNLHVAQPLSCAPFELLRLATLREIYRARRATPYLHKLVNKEILILELIKKLLKFL